MGLYFPSRRGVPAKEHRPFHKTYRKCNSRLYPSHRGEFTKDCRTSYPAVVSSTAHSKTAHDSRDFSHYL